jgi:hypothetical protein
MATEAVGVSFLSVKGTDANLHVWRPSEVKE